MRDNHGLSTPIVGRFDALCVDLTRLGLNVHKKASILRTMIVRVKDTDNCLNGIACHCHYVKVVEYFVLICWSLVEQQQQSSTYRYELNRLFLIPFFSFDINTIWWLLDFIITEVNWKWVDRKSILEHSKNTNWDYSENLRDSWIICRLQNFGMWV